ncbi:MAG: ankyrin repeat domain-containing protein, partial [Candidatus Delongbacteria bacterium]|nr:ankyrin repeat domain-containing protein [Candidatus Delongbacteria bacterium]
ADAVKLLIENNADVNVISTLNDQTPLMFALQNKNNAIIKMLKDKVADINAKDSYGNTALLQAITIDSVNMEEIKYLIANTNQINEFNNLGMSPLFKAVGLEHIELVRYLLQNGADINQKNYKGVDVLTVARKMKNNPEMIKLLQEYGSK